MESQNGGLLRGFIRVNELMVRDEEIGVRYILRLETFSPVTTELFGFQEKYVSKNTSFFSW